MNNLFSKCKRLHTHAICQSSKYGIEIKLFSSLCLIMVKNKSEGKLNFL